MDLNYEDNVVWSVEGWRTAAVTCKRCGVSLILSRTIDVMQVHDAWHLNLVGMAL
jgi:hypothetical protein